MYDMPYRRLVTGDEGLTAATCCKSSIDSTTASLNLSVEVSGLNRLDSMPNLTMSGAARSAAKIVTLRSKDLTEMTYS